MSLFRRLLQCATKFNLWIYAHGIDLLLCLIGLGLVIQGLHDHGW